MICGHNEPLYIYIVVGGLLNPCSSLIVIQWGLLWRLCVIYYLKRIKRMIKALTQAKVWGEKKYGTA